MTEVQKVILSIYKEVSALCDRHGIPCYAIGGTCIGAVRHQGFIPWDDDLDIAVPIEDYDRLRRLLEKELPDNLYVHAPDTARHYRFVWMKVCDAGTTFIEESEVPYRDAYKGVFVDIMPLSGVPEGRWARELFYRRLHRLARLNDNRRYPSTKQGLRGVLSRLLSAAMERILPEDYFSTRYLNLLKRYPFRSAKSIGYVWMEAWVRRLTFPQAWFGPGVLQAFEDTVIRCPSQTHQYLSHQFGDYMQLPPEEQRETHHGIVDLDHGYTTFVRP
ncbi:MAG: LicD family protein [Bacteroidales bacterium]|nr:LicD family protein [Bacteroidales bacterium]